MAKDETIEAMAGEIVKAMTAEDKSHLATITNATGATNAFKKAFAITAHKYGVGYEPGRYSYFFRACLKAVKKQLKTYCSGTQAAGSVPKRRLDNRDYKCRAANDDQ